MDILYKYFYGLLKPEEEQQVQMWLVEHSGDPEVVAMLERIWAEQEVLDEELSSLAFASVKSRLGLRANSVGRIVRSVLRYGVYAVVVMLLPILGAYLYSRTETQPEWLEVKVPYGQTKELMLSDGTHLYLNAGTRVTYPTVFTGDTRRVFVEGEVFAEVSTDPERPFIISSGDVVVEVYGTTFNYKAYDGADCVELFLLDGSVSMDISSLKLSREIDMKPGELVQFDRRSGELDMKRVNPLQYRGFHENRSLHFFNMRLNDIAGDLERTFGTKVIILDECLADSRYFAWFTNNEDLKQILNGLNVDGRMNYYTKNGVIYINKKK